MIPTLCLSALVCWPSAAPLGPGPAAQRSARAEALASDPVSDAIETLRSLRDPEAPSPAVLGEEIGALGAAVVPLLVGVLVERVVPAASDAAEPQALSIYQEEALLVALAGVDARALAAEVESRLEADGGFAVRRAAIQALGATGDRNRLARIVALARERSGAEQPAATGKPRTEGSDGPIERELANPLEVALACILGADPRAVEELSRTPIDGNLAVHVARAAGRAREPRTLELLAHLLDADPGLALLVATQVPLVTPARDPVLAVELARRLRRYLKPSDPQLAQVVVGALAALGDDESVPAMIALLEADAESLRRAAHAALGARTGLRLPLDAERWQSWLDEELIWFQNHEARTLRKMRSGDPASVTEALHELTQRRLFRARTALAVSRLVDERKAIVRRLGCEALGRLGEPAGVPALTQALDDHDKDVRFAAWAALERIAPQPLAARGIAARR